MLGDFIATHREHIIERTREKVGQRHGVGSSIDFLHGVPLFLDQLSARLRNDVGGSDLMTVSASLHGAELLKHGHTIGQVVHDYGNVCQAITELAVELKWQIANEDFQMLNLCLDIAIAEAVTEFARQREHDAIGRGVGSLAGNLRHLLDTATLAFDAVRSGSVAVGGSTGNLIGRSLEGMAGLVDRSLAESAGPPRDERILVAHLLEEIESAAAAQAKARGIQLAIEPVDVNVMVDADSKILVSIVTGLIQNACRFTGEHGHVAVRSRVSADRIWIDVIDGCGGLPPGKLELLFLEGSRLASNLKAAQAIGGELAVRDVPGVGCVFTVELRRSTSL